MENNKECEQNGLMNELTRGKDLVNQLRFHLSPNSSTAEFVIEQILSSFDRALLMLNCNGSEAELQVIPRHSFPMIESPQQSGSPRSDDSDDRDVSKKRKSMPRWTEQVRISSGSRPDGPHEDGHNWRKYGQKDILGAKYPRGYYRCTHRHAQGCMATKHVQRSDEDPCVFDITYRGKHTCNQSPSPVIAPQAIRRHEQKQHQDNSLQPQRKRKQPEELLQQFRSELRIKTEQENAQLACSPFSFPSATAIEYPTPENNIFSPALLENDYMGSFSSYINMSPTTPESNYFSPYHMNSIEGRSNFNTMDSELNQIISATTSPSNSPVVDLDFTNYQLDFEPNFPFDNSNFFN